MSNHNRGKKIQDLKYSIAMGLRKRTQMLTKTENKQQIGAQFRVIKPNWKNLKKKKKCERDPRKWLSKDTH